jgi:ComF family protein
MACKATRVICCLKKASFVVICCLKKASLVVICCLNKASFVIRMRITNAHYNRRRVSMRGDLLSNLNTESFDSAGERLGKSRGRAPRLLETLARFALPQRCELCVAPAGNALLCGECERSLPRVALACAVCGLPSSAGSACGACVATPPPYAATIAAFAYAFPTDRLIQRIKYEGRLALAEWAGAALAAAVDAALLRRSENDRPDCVVALPLAPERQRERGFNQAREIAVPVARRVGIPLAAPLSRVTAGPPQSRLPWNRRAQNVRGAFAVSSPVQGAHIALVDDVMTTGATLAEAARTLIKAGAERVECWVVARTLPR